MIFQETTKQYLYNKNISNKPSTQKVGVKKKMLQQGTYLSLYLWSRLRPRSRRADSHA